ncbi:hypothetical protein L204_105100 [Cryptococcus depauperatus]|nr:hypothetical protein L204_03748 [Cryptococcus depauperatus CBS 7855]
MSGDSTQRSQPSSTPSAGQPSDAATGNGSVNGAETSTRGNPSTATVGEESGGDPPPHPSFADLLSMPGAFDPHTYPELLQYLHGLLRSMGEEPEAYTPAQWTIHPSLLLAMDIEADSQPVSGERISQDDDRADFICLVNEVSRWLMEQLSASEHGVPSSDARGRWQRQ